MKQTDTKRPVKTAGYSFAKQAARRAKRREQAEQRASKGADKPFGLRQRIASAPTIQAISDRLESGWLLHGASDKTRRQWASTAKRRIEQLTNKKL